MRLPSALLFLMLASLPVAAFACDHHDHGSAKSKRIVGRESVWIAGEVREVDVDGATITLGHAKIALLRMRAMESMVFGTADAALLNGRARGEKVRFRVRLVDDQPTVTRLSPLQP